jgi:D-alanine transfer protein
LIHLRFKDRWDLARLIARKRLLPGAPQAAAGPIDWDTLERSALADAAAKTRGNRFGMEDAFYDKWVGPKLAELAGSSAGDTWLDSSEYGDLALSLRTLKALGARPLFISLPVLGSYYDFKGHPAADRRAYYARVRQMVEQEGFPVVDLSGNEYEPAYQRDPWHQGWKGSVQIARTLDQFYHSSLPDAGR